MISAFEKVVFVHIQKTAGTSLVKSLYPYFKKEEILHHGHFTEVPKTNLTSYRLISGHFGYDYIDQLSGNNLSFTFLREPVDRIVSFYYYCRTQNPEAYEIYRLAAKLSLRDFAQSDNFFIRSHIEDAQTWQLACGWTPDIRIAQADLSGEDLFAMAVDHLRKLSLVGLTENFEYHAQRIYSALGLTGILPLHANATDQRPLLDEIDRDTLEIIRSRVPLDEALYRYAKEELA